MSPVQSNAKPTADHSYPAFDYPVGIGTGLVAVKDGVIRDMPGVVTRQLYSGLQNGQAWPNAGGGSPNSGNVLVIDHGNNEYTAYLHVSPFHINLLRGKAVKRGEVFAYSGNNGWSTGAHLHFEYWKNGVRVDPNVIINQGGDMPITQGQLDKLIKMAKSDEPRPDELNNKAYMSDPGLAIDAMWGGYGKGRYENRFLGADVEQIAKDSGVPPTPADKASVELGFRKPKDLVYHWYERTKKTAKPDEFEEVPFKTYKKKGE